MQTGHVVDVGLADHWRSAGSVEAHRAATGVCPHQWPAGHAPPEQLARAAGATTIGLNVFANNVVARSLYSSLNYQESSVQMRKAL